MIELPEQQVEVLEQAAATPPRVVNPRTKETFVLLRLDDYERLIDDEYEDREWSQASACDIAASTCSLISWSSPSVPPATVGSVKRMSSVTMAKRGQVMGAGDF